MISSNSVSTDIEVLFDRIIRPIERSSAIVFFVYAMQSFLEETCYGLF